MDTAPLKENKNLLPAIIIGLCIIMATMIYAFSNRYEIEGWMRIDKWTGKYQTLERK